MTEQDHEYELSKTHLAWRGDTLIRYAKDGGTIAEFNAADIKTVEISHPADKAVIVAAAFFTFISLSALLFAQSEGWKWSLTILFGLLTLICLAAFKKNLFCIELADERVEFDFRDHPADAKAFLSAVKREMKLLNSDQHADSYASYSTTDIGNIPHTS